MDKDCGVVVIPSLVHYRDEYLDELAFRPDSITLVYPVVGGRYNPKPMKDMLKAIKKRVPFAIKEMELNSKFKTNKSRNPFHSDKSYLQKGKKK